MRHMLFAAALSLASIAGCAKSESAGSGSAAAKEKEQAKDSLPTMTVDEVDAALTAKQAVAVDCNSERTRKRLGVLPGAIVVSDEETFAASELPADKATKLVFYCANEG
jgi:hypothetical protein